MPKKPKFFMILSIELLTTVILILMFLFWAKGNSRLTLPPTGMSFEEKFTANAKTLRKGQDIRMVSYNIAYGRGPKDDAGDLRDRKTIIAYLDQIVERIKNRDADIAVLQEVDFDSARTHHINQMEYIANKLGWPYRAWISTWMKNYVPYPYWPPTQHYGQMHSGQAVLSKIKIVNNTALPLPQPEKNPFYYNWFYLHRHTQHVSLKLNDDQQLELLNIHLEAFDNENREQHAQLLTSYYEPMKTQLVLLAGDFNAVPDFATVKKGFADEPETDMTSDRTIATLLSAPNLKEVVSKEEYLFNEKQYLTFPADAPNRRLDYIFHTPRIIVQDKTIDQNKPAASDHAPVYMKFQVPY